MIHLQIGRPAFQIAVNVPEDTEPKLIVAIAAEAVSPTDDYSAVWTGAAPEDSEMRGSLWFRVQPDATKPEELNYEVEWSLVMGMRTPQDRTNAIARAGAVMEMIISHHGINTQVHRGHTYVDFEGQWVHTIALADILTAREAEARKAVRAVPPAEQRRRAAEAKRLAAKSAKDLDDGDA